MNKLNSYDLSRSWFNYSFEHPNDVKPAHTSIYFFAIEHCNRLGWKEKFGFPTTMVMEAIGIKSYNTYINALNDLVDFGFIKLIEKSKNQWSSNIIALSYFNKAHNKALDKALIKHGRKQHESTGESIDSIIKQINNKQYNNKQLNKLHSFLDVFLNKNNSLDFYNLEIENNKTELKINEYKTFVNYLFGKNDYNEPMNNILNLKKQVSYKQYVKILDLQKDFKNDKTKKISNILNQMENNKKYTKDRKDVYGFIANWIRKEF